MRRFIQVIKWFCILVVSTLLLWFAASYAMYRIPNGDERRLFEGEVHYKVLELSFANRQLVEELIANRIVRLQGHPLFYVSETDHAKLYPESPLRMSESGYTFRARLTARPLLFGGHGLAEVINVERIEKEPIVSK